MNKNAVIEDCRQSRAEGKRQDTSTVGVNECISRNVKCIRCRLEPLECRCDILRSPDSEWCDFDAERAGHRLNLTHLEHGFGKASISYDRQPAEPGQNLTQELEALAGKIGRLDRQSSDVAAWSRQT